MRTLAWIIAAALGGAPLPAAAHAILMESAPAAEATVPPGRTHVMLRFNSRIDQGRSKVELRGPGAPVVIPFSPSSRPDTLVLDPVLAPGTWVLRWQVLAVDGHITRGDVPLTVKAP